MCRSTAARENKSNLLSCVFSQLLHNNVCVTLVFSSLMWINGETAVQDFGGFLVT